MTLGEKIREFAIAKYGQKGAISKLAVACDVTPATLQQYLSDRSAPGTPLLKKLFKLGCDLNWLLDDSATADEKASVRITSKEDFNEIVNLKLELERYKSKLTSINEISGLK